MRGSRGSDPVQAGACPPGPSLVLTTFITGTGAGNFADSVLHLMSRNDTSLLGAGDLDDLAIYTTKLSATTIHQHYQTATAL